MLAVAQATGTSKSWVHRHVQFFRSGGEAALEPLRRGPKRAPALTSPEVEDEIAWWHNYLDDAGLDAGARTIHYHLRPVHDDVPAVSAIQRDSRKSASPNRQRSVGGHLRWAALAVLPRDYV